MAQGPSENYVHRNTQRTHFSDVASVVLTSSVGIKNCVKIAHRQLVGLVGLHSSGDDRDREEQELMVWMIMMLIMVVVTNPMIVTVILILREASLKKASPLFGHCRYSHC